MSDALKAILEGRLADTCKVIVPNTSVLAIVNLVDVKLAAELCLLTLSIAYTLWRWRKDARK